MLIEQVDELALLCRAGIGHLVGDEDGAQARDGQRPRVEARLEIINILDVRHGDGFVTRLNSFERVTRTELPGCGRRRKIAGDERLLNAGRSWKLIERVAESSRFCWTAQAIDLLAVGGLVFNDNSFLSFVDKV